MYFSSVSNFQFYPYYKIIRPVNCILSGFALFVGIVIVLGPDVLIKELPIFTIGALIMFFVAAGGFVINDIFDIEIDRINQPHRMLPLKRISLKVAWLYSMVLFGFALILSFYVMTIPTDLNLGLIPILFPLFGILSLILYAKWFKRYGLFGNLVISILSVIPLMVGGFFINEFTRSVFPVLVGFLLIYSREIIKDIEDIKGDVEASDRFYSLPVLIGITPTVFIIRILLIALIFSTYYPFIFQISYFFSYSTLLTVIILNILVLWVLFSLKGKGESLRQKAKKGRKILKVSIILGLTGFLLNSFTLLPGKN
jgi:geranylgeranylglycerol-phosphate geranylgeranyltransferase